MARVLAGWIMGGVVLLTLIAVDATAQMSSISPEVLYPGENVITVAAPGGVRSVRVEFADSISMRYTEARNLGPIDGCPTATDVEFTLNVASFNVRLNLIVELCDGEVLRHPLSINTVWNLDEVLFPDALVGEEICRPFRISMTGLGGGPQTFLDSVTSTDPRVSFKYSFSPPIGISRGTVYRYNVCFIADKPGTYRFPVITWIKRDNPAGGYMTYPVADTGVVRIVERFPAAELEVIDFEEKGVEEGQLIIDSATIHSIDSVKMLSSEEEKLTFSSFGASEAKRAETTERSSEGTSTSTGTYPSAGEAVRREERID